MRTFSKLVLLALHFVILSQAVLADEAPKKEEGFKHELRMGVRASSVLNDDFKIKWTTFQPAFLYRFSTGEGLRFGSVIAVLYNRLELGLPLSHDFGLVVGAETFITLAGDSPRVDGKDLDEYKFEAHRFPFFIGFQWRAPQDSAPFEAKLTFDFENLNTYDESKDPRFIPPSYSWDMGPYLRAKWGSGSSHELEDRGSRLLAVTTYKVRTENKAWGAVTFLRNVDHYFKGSLGFVTNQELASKWMAVIKAQGSFVSNADRMNALRSLSFSQDSSGLISEDERADRAVTSEVGLRYYFTNQLAVRPFVHGVLYRELTPTRFRNGRGLGGGLKFSHAVTQKFHWDLQYANLFGTRSDLSGLHQVQMNVSYHLF